MIALSLFQGYIYTLECDVPVYVFCEIIGYRRKGEQVMFQGKQNGEYLYC